MLSALIDGIDGVLEDRDRARVRELLDRERGRLLDPAHLVAHVIGDTEFEWDFSVLKPGFLDLADPFMREPSGCAELFLLLLRELGRGGGDAENAVVLIEYTHYATRINDHFNWHDAFADETPDFAVAESMIQLRYAAQFLNNYPRYLLIENRLGASNRARIGIHRWGPNAFTATGISRALFTTWSRTGFAGLKRDHWLQNSVNGLVELLLTPAVTACILADVDSETQRAVKRAFSHLAVAAALRVERRGLRTPVDARAETWHDVLLPARCPGYTAATRGVAVDPAPFMGTRFPRIRPVVAALQRAAAQRAGADLEAELRALELHHAATFRAGLAPTGLWPRVAERLERAFSEP